MRVGDSKLMCPKHWYKVPQFLRGRIRSAYRRHGVGSEELREAQADAIATVK